MHIVCNVGTIGMQANIVSRREEFICRVLECRNENAVGFTLQFYTG